MRIAISLTLACLFVFLAGFNLWNMLTSPGSSAVSKRRWTQVHRAAGYSFIALYLILCYFMLMRIKGWSDELSPRLIVHMSLALLLAPLLVAKVVAARYQKAARGLLMALGIAIFSAAFTLVTLNLSIHYLRLASTDKLQSGISTGIVMVVVILATLAYWLGMKRPRTAQPTQRLDSIPTSTAAPMNPGEAFTLSLARIQVQSRDAKTLRFLVPPEKQIDARAGQFLTFEWMIDGKAITRSYSICSSPLQKGFVEITPKRVPNGIVSTFLNDRASVGLQVKTRGPYGKFCFDERQHRRIVLLAGGSGITPMLAMLRYIDDMCLRVDATLVYCARTMDDLFFRPVFEEFESRLSGFRFVPVLSQPDAAWTGWSGRLRSEILEREIDRLLEATFFLCGPPAFMETARTLLKELRVDAGRVLQESFGGAVASDAPRASAAGSVTVTLARSAVAFGTTPRDTLLESSEKNGVLIPSGCRQGQCGTCLTKLLSGEVRMEQAEALTDEQRSLRYILPCVSRPLGDVTLDA